MPTDWELFHRPDLVFHKAVDSKGPAEKIGEAVDKATN